MMTNWEVKRLGEICEIANERNNRKDVPYVGMEDIESNTANFLGSTEPRNVKSATFYFTAEHILYGRLRPYLNKVLLPNFDGHCSTEIFPIKVNKSLKKKYLFYWITSDEIVQKINGTCTGARMPRANMKEVFNFAIPLPPLPEQNSIVAILDEAFAAIATAKENAEKNLQNARELFESYLQSVFANTGDGWEVRKLGVLGVITSSKRIFKSEYVKTGVPFYRTKEIKELAHGKEISLELFISQDRYNEIKNKFGIPISGDILLSAVGTIGEMYVVQKGDEFYFKDGNIVWLKDFNSVDTYYLKYALTSFVEQIKKLSIGSAYNALTIEKLNDYSVPIATLPEQRAIVSKLDALSAETKKLEEIYQQKLNDLDELKKSVLQKAFKGDL